MKILQSIDRYFAVVIITIMIIVSSCGGTKTISVREKTPQKTNINANQINEQMLLQTGVDFFAEGTTPSKWSLSMNYDDTVKFVAEDGLQLKIAYNQLSKNKNTDGEILRGKINGADITIVKSDKACTTSDRKKNTTFSFNKNIYSGCGNFLGDKMLEGRWVLDKIENVAIKRDEYNSTPFIKFNVSDQNLQGSDGCNNINSSLELQGKRIQFGNIASTKRGCDKKSIQSIISNKLNGRLVSYYFAKGNLLLYLIDDSILEFKRE